MTGPELRAIRKALNLTQAALAALLEIHPNTVARIERGVIAIEHPAWLLARMREIEAELKRKG